MRNSSFTKQNKKVTQDPFDILEKIFFVVSNDRGVVQVQAKYNQQQCQSNMDKIFSY